MMSSYEKIVLQRSGKGRKIPPVGSGQAGSSGSSSGSGSGSGSSSSRPVGKPQASVASIISSDDIETKGLIQWHVWNPNKSWNKDNDNDDDNDNSNESGSGSGGTLQWTILHRLRGCHDRPVTHLDWSMSDRETSSGEPEPNPKDTADRATNGRIVSCGEDCRAFVWSYSPPSQQWTPSQVVLQRQTICYTPLFCQWDPTGQRVAIAMGGNRRTASLEICQLGSQSEVEVDGGDTHGGGGCWTAFQVGRREIGSSVLCLAWHPCRYQEMQIVACGGCDNRCRVFSVSSGNHHGNSEDHNAHSGHGGVPFDEVLSFGKQYEEFDTDGGGWVIAVAWSPSGDALAYSSQDSTVRVVTFQQSGTDKPSPRPVAAVVRLDDRLPMCGVLFCNEDRIVAGGYGGTPVSISRGGAGDGAGDRRWAVDYGVGWEIWNRRGGGIRRGGGGGIEGSGSSGVAEGNDPLPAIRCMQRSCFGLGGGSVSAVGQELSVCVSASGADGSFSFLKLKTSGAEQVVSG